MEEEYFYPTDKVGCWLARMQIPQTGTVTWEKETPFYSLRLIRQKTRPIKYRITFKTKTTSITGFITNVEMFNLLAVVETEIKNTW